jgi:hypothetical protein
MSRLGCRVRAGGKLAASICAGFGVAALSSVWSDSAAAKGRRDVKRDEAALARSLGTPVMAIVSLNQQRVTIYDADGSMLQAPVSTGRTGYETPAGIYTVLEKRAEHYSNLYDDAAMPFMQRITWSGIALHAGALPGRPASHGCIRLPMSFAERLFDRTKLGMRVIVVRDDIGPADFSHPALFRPWSGEVASSAPGEAATRVADASPTAGVLPPARPRVNLKAIAAAKAAAAAAATSKAEELRKAARSATIEGGRAVKQLRRAEAFKTRAEQLLRQAEQRAASNASEQAQQAKAAAQAALTEAQERLDRVKAEMQPKADLAPQLREQAKEAAAASLTAQEEAKEAARKLSPVSVFISRATQRLYVRQAREPLFDTPVTIAEPDRPLGTYVFTALSYTQGEADLRWNVVSMYRSQGGPGAGAAKRRDHRDHHASVAPADHLGAKAALDRIEIPKEAAERISEMAAPGASLIVSDEGLSRETGKATEFIVVMSGEPQGGIKIRRRPAEARGRAPRPSNSYGWSGSSPFLFW